MAEEVHEAVVRKGTDIPFLAHTQSLRTVAI